MADNGPKQPNNNAKSIDRWDDEGGAPSGGRVTGKYPKRPRDPNQLAKFIVDVATGEATDPDPDQGKDPAAVKRGGSGGLKGGRGRPERMTPAERKASARNAVTARWSKPARRKP
jgi:hypothetical protein